LVKGSQRKAIYLLGIPWEPLDSRLKVNFGDLPLIPTFSKELGNFKKLFLGRKNWEKRRPKKGVWDKIKAFSIMGSFIKLLGGKGEIITLPGEPKAEPLEKEGPFRNFGFHFLGPFWLARKRGLNLKIRGGKHFWEGAKPLGLWVFYSGNLGPPGFGHSLVKIPFYMSLSPGGLGEYVFWKTFFSFQQFFRVFWC